LLFRKVWDLQTKALYLGFEVPYFAYEAIQWFLAGSGLPHLDFGLSQDPRAKWLRYFRLSY
jgi:hypothetical protein